jgi:outer membrane protein assembly factor BamB
MTLDSAWSTEIDPVGYDADIYSHSSDSICVGTGAETPADVSPAIWILDFDTGQVRGSVQVEGRVDSMRYCEPSDMLIVGVDDVVRGIDPQTGDERWARTVGTVGFDTNEKLVTYMGADVGAYRASDGTQIWKTTLPEEVVELPRSGASIEFLDGRLLVRVGQGSNNGGLVAVVPETGDVEWYNSSDREKTYLIDETGIFLAPEPMERDNRIARIDVTTGSERWSYTTDDRSISPNKLYSDHDSVYLQESTEGIVTALDIASGQVRWQSEQYLSIKGVWLTESTVYVCWRDDDMSPELHAVSPETGYPAWRVKLDGYAESLSIDEASDELYVGTNDVEDDEGMIYNITADTGEIRWRFRTGETVRDLYCDADPVFVGPFSNTFYALEKQTGNVSWKFSDEFAPPIEIDTTDDRIVIQDSAGVSILHRETGDQLVHLEPNTFTVGERALFALDDRTISAYPLAGSPFATGADTSTTETAVYTGSSELETEIYRDSGTDGKGESTAEGVSFCPHCGSNITDYDAIEFCPQCGSRLDA